jgi:ADP-ribosyl-[dinitrogen reductase] hydrolase
LNLRDAASALKDRLLQLAPRQPDAMAQVCVGANKPTVTPDEILAPVLFTSRNSPLEISAVMVPSARASIGLIHCPGMKHVRGDIEWDRSLEKDLDALKAWGARALLTLIEPHEFQKLGVADLGSRVSASMRWHWVPIPDGGVLDEANRLAWIDVKSELVSDLRSGRNVAIHCHAGLGRSGTMAADLLTAFGMSSADAIAAVRKSRPGAIQTPEQERYVGSSP